MSLVPTSLAGSILQTPLVQQQAGESQRADTEAKENAFRERIQAAERQDGTVSAGGEDTRVNVDGGGTGSQGRAFRETPADHAGGDEASQADHGITVDDAGQVHVDLEA